MFHQLNRNVTYSRVVGRSGTALMPVRVNYFVMNPYVLNTLN
jgi:hypothetical protein